MHTAFREKFFIAFFVLCLTSVIPSIAWAQGDTSGPPQPNYLHHIPYQPSENTIAAVIEIPAGTTEKWEMTEDGTAIQRDQIEGNPRTIAYLGYPANYGLIPQTLMADNGKGDGDPLDILVLGPVFKRGTVLQTHVIGVMKLNDDGERDDKIIAATPQSPFAGITSPKDLDREFPGVTDILKTWFLSYKGSDRVSFKGWGTASDAMRVIEASYKDYREVYPNELSLDIQK
jgi:inorganic pyrophosphatase